MPLVHIASTVILTMHKMATFQTYCAILRRRYAVAIVDTAPTCFACIAFHQAPGNSLWHSAVRVVLR